MVMLKRNRFIASDQLRGVNDKKALCGEEEIAEPASAIFPRANLYEEEDGWLFTFEIPGVEPSEVEIRLKDSRLIVQGKRISYHRSRKSRIHSREICIGACGFARTMKVPEAADPASLRVRIEHGMLLASMRKRSEGGEEGAESVPHQAPNEREDPAA